MKTAKESEKTATRMQPAPDNKKASSSQIKHLENFSEIITQSRDMLKIFRYIEEIKDSPLPVLITGETGTGKDLLAYAVHKSSGRKGNFITAKVGELEKGYNELVEKAKNGSLFINEIVDLPIQSQVLLYNLIQEMEDNLTGKDVQASANVRIIAATSRDLEVMKKNGEFREDLDGHLHHRILLPSLRERKGDIPLLVRHFLILSAQRLKKEVPDIPGDLFPLLESYDFPGNIRELAGMVFEAMNRFQSGSLPLDTFRDKIKKQSQKKDKKIIFNGYFPNFEEMREIYIREALERTCGDIQSAAVLTGLPLSAFDTLSKIKRRTVGNG